MSEVASEGEVGPARAAVKNTAVKNTKVVRGYPLVGGFVDHVPANGGDYDYEIIQHRKAFDHADVDASLPVRPAGTPPA